MGAWYGNTDDQLEYHLYSFSQAAISLGSGVGLSPAQVTAIGNAYSQFVTDRQNWQIARDAAKAATQAKATARTDAIDLIRQLANIVRSNPNATDSIIAQFGMPVHDTSPTYSAPNIPAELTAFGCSDGTNLLKWKPNGNIQGTRYFIEVMMGNSGVWELQDVVTAARYTHTGVTPGQMMTYRVFAKRNTQQSAPSNEAVVYAEGGASTITLSTAA